MTAVAMRAIDIQGGSGPASALFLSDSISKPMPSPSEALVKVSYFGLNRMDLGQRNGTYPVPPQAGKILGVEFSGVIESFGDDSAKSGEFSVGDEVFGLAYGGTYAEFVAVSTNMLIHKPLSLSFETAAAIPEVWITATQAMSLIGGFSAGRSILWHAGASSVSIAGIQLSKILGASAIYTTVGSKEKAEFCASLGATKAWCYRDVDWAVELMKETGGKGVDIIIDFVGQNYFQKNLDCTALDGCVIIVGLLSGPKTPEGIDLTPFVKNRIRVEGSRLRSRAPECQGRLRDMLVKDALPRFVDGTLKVPIEKVFDWKDIQDAHRLMESNAIMGKIVCRIT